jgi:hypothetical protein
LLCAAVSALFQIATAPNASASQVLESDLINFAILGGAGVTVDGTGSMITGSVGGCCNASAITGYPAEFTDSDGTVYLAANAVTTAAHGELGTAITALNGLALGSKPLGSLDNMTLVPGVYSVSATDFTENLTLNGEGNANALWVFLVSSSLTTASTSVINLINTGSDAGVYWVMGASATLGSNSTFEGNILAPTAISVGTNVTDPCGGLLTQTASVTLAGTDKIGIGCSGGATLVTPPTGGTPVVTPLPFQSIPEPSTVLLLCTGIACLVARRPRSARGRQRDLAFKA